METNNDATDFQACVSRKVEILHAEDPKRKQSQNVAIAYKHCKENWQKDSRVIGDSVKYTNQILATEGVLDYNGRGFLKPWEDLKKMDGKIIPIIDEHPSKDNGNDGMVSGKEKVYGYATLHQCVKGEHILCFDAVLSNDSPTKNGYSQGFIYNQEDKNGEYLGKKYDGIHHITDIDHIALTNYPRNDIAIADQIHADSITQTPLPSNNEIIKSQIGYDSFNTFKVDKSENITKNQVESMPEKTSTNEELLKEMDAIKKVIADLSKPSNPPPSVSADSKPLEKETEVLKQQIAKAETDAKLYKEKYEKAMMDSVTRDVNTLHSETGIDPKLFEGDSKSAIDGAMKLWNHLKKQPKSSIQGSTEIETDANKSTEMDSIQNYRWNAKLNAMEPINPKGAK